jgi:predicted dithiol-disulfide oxidoreductase (DUF899 family)
MPMTDHDVATSEEWQAARDELLAREKEHTREADELARLRRDLPWVAIEKDYRFDTEAGEKSLADLFDGRSQLLMYHFMFGPAYEAGCPVCSSAADTYDGQVAHLNARDVTFTCASRAPLDKLLGYRDRMGWSFPWVSTAGSDFNFDFGASHTEDEIRPVLEQGAPPVVEQLAGDCGTDPLGFMSEGPALSAFRLEDGTVYKTYSTTARGLEPAMSYYGLLDRTSKGRDEGDAQVHWLRRHDEY